MSFKAKMSTVPWKKVGIAVGALSVVITIMVLSIELSKCEKQLHKLQPHKSTGATFQQSIKDAFNSMTRSGADSAPTPLGDDVPHKYQRQGDAYRYRLGFRPEVHADGMRGPGHATGSNSEIDIYGKRNMGSNSEIDIYGKRNLGANSEIDINKQRNGLGASTDYDLSRLPMGSADAGPIGVKLSDAYSSDYTAPAQKDEGSTYVDYSDPADQSKGPPPGYASEYEAAAPLLSDVYGAGYDFSGQGQDKHSDFIGLATPDSR